MKNITIKTISENTKLSLTTVSRVLNGVAEKYRISQFTSDKVLKEAKRLGYVPNQVARNLRLQKSFAIGLVLPSLANPYFSTIASIVNQALHAEGFLVLVSDGNEEEEAEIDAITNILARNIDGMIIIPSGKNTEHFEMLSKKGIPVVFIDRYFSNLSIPYVATDHYQGAFKMVDLLVKHGHKKIACIQGSQHVMSNLERVNGYYAAVKKHNLTYDYVGGNGFTAEEGYMETKLLLQRKEKPTAIFALSDTILLGVLKALDEEGYRIPDEMSVVSFDNSVYLDYLSCPVTSISQPVSEIAQIAIRLLLTKIKANAVSEKKTADVEQILIAPTIIQRKSIKDIS